MAPDVPSHQLNGTTTPNGEHPNLNSTSDTRQRERSPWYRNAITNFGGAWFTISMNTGVLALLLHQQPYTFRGLPTIATILYILDILLFSIFSIISITKWTCYPHIATRKTQGNIDEIAMLGALPIAWIELAALTALIPSQANWGHAAFGIVAVVMWWCGVVWMLVTCFGVMVDIFHHDVTSDRTLSPSLFLPTVGLATDAVAGALICEFGFGVSAGLAVPVLVMGYLLNGMALFLALYIYTLYFHRLVAVGWPEGPKLPGLMLLVGPFGQTAAALLLSGSAASTTLDFAHYNAGTFLTMAGGESAASAGVLIALLLLGHDFFWFVVACCGIVKGVVKGELSYNLLWWATIFPNATMTTSFIALSTAMDSSTFRVLAAIFTILLAADYIVNCVFTVWYSIKGSLLIKPGDEYITNDKAD